MNVRRVCVRQLIQLVSRSLVLFFILHLSLREYSWAGVVNIRYGSGGSRPFDSSCVLV